MQCTTELLVNVILKHSVYYNLKKKSSRGLMNIHEKFPVKSHEQICAFPSIFKGIIFIIDYIQSFNVA